MSLPKCKIGPRRGFWPLCPPKKIGPCLFCFASTFKMKGSTVLLLQARMPTLCVHGACTYLPSAHGVFPLITPLRSMAIATECPLVSIGSQNVCSGGRFVCIEKMTRASHERSKYTSSGYPKDLTLAHSPNFAAFCSMNCVAQLIDHTSGPHPLCAGIFFRVISRGRTSARES
ncbi:hypothetical protein BC835DRAFT_735859 [Cytidiella melzeri]|nr:hypothetical protein BC835DRAFT_735859 [Cytidiella melzeri]